MEIQGAKVEMAIQEESVIILIQAPKESCSKLTDWEIGSAVKDVLSGKVDVSLFMDKHVAQETESNKDTLKDTLKVSSTGDNTAPVPPQPREDTGNGNEALLDASNACFNALDKALSKPPTDDSPDVPEDIPVTISSPDPKPFEGPVPENPNVHCGGVVEK